MKIVPGSDGWPEAYDYTVDGRTTRIEGEAAPGVRRVLHMRLLHPVNDHYGLSPIEAAACAIDLHNAAAKWNKALLDNSARPSGSLVYTSRDGNLTPDQFDRLKSELEVNYQGSGNAGRPLLLEGGLDWKAMSMTPKYLDFVEAKNAAAREIALALGVPPLLLGIPGDNTYANYQEANSALWRQTIIPLVERIALQLGNWLSASYGIDDLRLSPDTDSIVALAPERDALWTRIDKASFLTTDEKRALAGYGPENGGHKHTRPFARKYSPDQPRDDQGRWTDGGGGAISPGNEPTNDPPATPTIGNDDPNLIRVQAADDDPPLKRLHPDKTYESDRLAKSSLEHWRKQSTDDIVESLKPGSKQPLTTYPDGTVANGNTRLKVLEERGYDATKLPRTVLPRSGAPFSNPNLRPGGGPLGKKPPRI